MKRDYYEVLGVSKDADEAEIKKAFRRLAREYHPDVSQDADAEAKFKELAEAYEVLSDADSRAAYDHYGFDGLKGRPMPNFEQFEFADLFQAFFGGGGGGGAGGGLFGDLFGGAGAGAAAQSGDNVLVEVRVSLAEAMSGISRSVSVAADVVCDRCGGNGAQPGTLPRACSQCGGSGQVRQVSSMGGFAQFIRSAPCPTCKGRGTIVDKPCEKCHGAGRFAATREVGVDVPAGIADGQRMRINGKGGAPGPGGRAGDLYVHVTVEADERFMRDGDDLIHQLDVTMVQAALGDTLEVPALDGDPIELKLSPGTQPGDVRVFRGRGMPALHGRHRGALKVAVNVAVPRHLSAEQRKLLEEFEALSSEKNYEPDDGFFDRMRAAFRQ
jgi:molecular chaperone DnaJ